MRRLQMLTGAAALALTAGMAAVPQADGATIHRTLASGLVSPLSVAVDDDGATYFTQNFAGILNKARRGKAPKVLYRTTNGNEVGGVSVRHGKVVFTETASDPNSPEPSPVDSWLKRLTRTGKVKTIAHIRAFENRRNPDRHVIYGFRSIPSSCAHQWPTQALGPATYRGIKDSHPYATWQTGQRILVADAGMNAILSVTRGGRIHVVKVLPAVPVQITAELVAAMNAQPGGPHIPECVVGLTYWGEPVPTDVQKTSDGSIYVTTLGGGLGEQMPLSALYKIRGKRLHKVVGGLFGATGLAVSPRGDVYVAQLFKGEISKVRRNRHRARTFATTNMPGALDWHRGLYATVDVLAGLEPGQMPAGKVVKFR